MIALRGATVGALWRLGSAEALAYRASLFVWILTTTFPLVSLALWSALAAEGPIGSYTQSDFVAYFVAAFLIRQMSASWVVWDLDRQIRVGDLDSLLLRPVHPLLHHAVSNLAALPLRLLLAVPLGVLVLVFAGGVATPADPMLLALVPLAIAGAWLINFLGQVAVACLSFWLTSATSLYEIWLGLFIVFSGYAVPTSLFPAWLAEPVRASPFHAALGFPVELLSGRLDLEAAVSGLMLQWIWIGLFGLAAAISWRKGLRVYAAVGA